MDDGSTDPEPIDDGSALSVSALQLFDGALQVTRYKPHRSWGEDEGTHWDEQDDKRNSDSKPNQAEAQAKTAAKTQAATSVDHKPIKTTEKVMVQTPTPAAPATDVPGPLAPTQDDSKVHLAVYVDYSGSQNYKSQIEAFRCYAATQGYDFVLLGATTPE